MLGGTAAGAGAAAALGSKNVARNKRHAWPTKTGVIQSLGPLDQNAIVRVVDGLMAV